MGSLGIAAVVISVIALLVAAAAALDLSRGAPRGERWLWVGAGVLLAAAAAQRVAIAVQYERSAHPLLPASAQASLLFGAIMLAAIAALIRPVILRYRRAERARRESDERFRRALGAASDPVGIIDGAGVYHYVNDAGCVFFDYPREQILGHHFREFIADVDPSSKGTVDRAVGAGAAQVEREVRRGDGTAVPVLCDLIALGDGNVLVIGHDLTPSRDAAASRARAARLEAVSTLAAGVAHDFNNLLSVIGISLEMAIETDDQPEHLDRAARATTRASGLARELIDFARATVERARRPAGVTADLRAVVNDAVEAAREGLDGRVTLTASLPSAPLAVAGDADDVHRICANLLANARDAVLESFAQDDPPAAGRIEVVVRAAEAAPDAGGATGAAGDGAAAEIVVHDSGVGMAPEVRDRIFEPFFTTKSARGYGIGLAATRELIVQLDGAIAVDSQPGAGTTFTVRLPAAPAASGRAAVSTASTS